MTRALGDFWSKSSETGMYVVQPVPDVSMTELNPVEDDFVVLATDGVTNALSPSEIMALLKKYDGSENANGYPLNHAQLLVKSALTRWKQTR
uniref:PPM-type phosphatase domain-containing protein n=1 Tax=Ditylenchus dipsaci TaxID=166011 RepID=A0A915D0I0_9BILA